MPILTRNDFFEKHLDEIVESAMANNGNIHLMSKYCGMFIDDELRPIHLSPTTSVRLWTDRYRRHLRDAIGPGDIVIKHLSRSGAMQHAEYAHRLADNNPVWVLACDCSLGWATYEGDRIYSESAFAGVVHVSCSTAYLVEKIGEELRAKEAS